MDKRLYMLVCSDSGGGSDPPLIHSAPRGDSGTAFPQVYTYAMQRASLAHTLYGKGMPISVAGGSTTNSATRTHAWAP